MSEADWWLCASCSSLNNLAARKCYSCGRRKSKDAVRASEYLGYRPVVSWDGKVRLENLTAEELERLVPRAAGMTSQLAPLREPVQRNTLAVAPRPPHPARITYRLVEPAPGAPLTLPPLHGRAVSPATPRTSGVGGAPGPLAVPVGPGRDVTAQPPGTPRAGGAPGPLTVPVGPGPDATAQPPGTPRAGGAPGPLAVPVGPGPDATAQPPGTPRAGGAPGPLAVPVGPGPDPAGQPPGQQWPHWRELLDGPVPHAERLRTATNKDATSGSRTASGSRPDGMTLRSAIRLARTGDAREFVAWPEVDLRPDEVEGAADERPASSTDPRPPE